MNKLLTPQEIAEYLGVQPSTIYQWTHEGFIPYVKIKNLSGTGKMILINGLRTERPMGGE